MIPMKADDSSEDLMKKHIYNKAYLVGRASMREEAADLVEFKTDILETRHITAERIRAIDSKL